MRFFLCMCGGGFRKSKVYFHIYMKRNLSKNNKRKKYNIILGNKKLKNTHSLVQKHKQKANMNLPLIKFFK